MKYLLLLSILLLFACNTDDDDRIETVSGCAEGLREGNTFRLPDGTLLRLVESDNKFCPCDVQCVAAGSWDAKLVLENDPSTSITLKYSGSRSSTLYPRTDTIAGYTVTFDTIYTKIGCEVDIADELVCIGLSAE